MSISRILIVEPDPASGGRLRKLVTECIESNVIVVHSAGLAIEVLGRRTPDVILTSALLSPAEEARLASHLELSETLPEIPVLVVSPLQAEEPRQKRSWFGSRRKHVGAQYDRVALTARIGEAIQQSRRARDEARERGYDLRRTSPLILKSAVEEEGLIVAPSAVDTIRVTRSQSSFVRPAGTHRSRAARRAPVEIHWHDSAQTAAGLSLKIVNISGSGMLVESPTKLTPGITTEFRLDGPGHGIVVPARVVRSELAAADIRGVRYQIAAAFERPVRLEERPDVHTALAPSPKQLVELLAKVSTEIGFGRKPEAVKETFEQGVRQLTSARAVRIVNTAQTREESATTFCFPLPGDGDESHELRVTFDEGSFPTPDELRLLKAAAAAAGIVMLFQPAPSVAMAQCA
jgi:hypothetical protein